MSGPLDVVAGVIWRGGRFLAVQRPEGKSHAGFWEFPGGKMRPGETGEQALVRELREELGFTASEISFWLTMSHVYDFGEVRLFFYHVRGLDAEPRPMEGQAMRWVRPEEAGELGFLPADEEVLAKLVAM